MEGDKMLYNMYFMINWLIFVKDRRWFIKIKNLGVHDGIFMVRIREIKNISGFCKFC